MDYDCIKLTNIFFSMKEFYKAIYKEDFRIIVTYFGYVKWSFGGQLETTCSLDLAEYPFDRQECSIQMENFVYPSLLVSKFFLLPTSATSCVHLSTCCTSYISLIFRQRSMIIAERWCRCDDAPMHRRVWFQ